MGAGASADGKSKEELVGIAEQMLGKKLLKGDAEIDTSTAFEGKRAIALYFSAHWCPPCRGFTPKLAEYYKDCLSEKGLEVVFVSSDRDEEGFKEYYKEMPWLALPYSERDMKGTLSQKYKVQGIPALIILDATTGEVITKDGRGAIMRDPKGEKFPWIPPTFKEALGEKLLKGEETVGQEAIEGKTLGLYFSAHWCPPCRSFTPQLAEWYKKIKPEVGDKFEIIFCSGDRDEEAMKSYYKEQCDAGGDWLALTYENKDNLDEQFEISGIPSFIIVDPSGKVINKSGRGLVPDAVAADFPWAPPPVGDLENPDGINETLSMCLMLEGVDPEVQKNIMTAVEPIAKKYSEEGDKKVLFFAAKKPGNVATQIRGMTGLPGTDTLSKQDTSPEEDGPKLIRTTSNDTPTVILFNLPDKGGYYVGKMARELDGSGIQKMLDDFFDNKLERKQLE